MTALHTLLTLAGVNPALIVQFWSQVMYWTACEFCSMYCYPRRHAYGQQARFLTVSSRARSICVGMAPYSSIAYAGLL